MYIGIDKKENYYLVELCWVSIAFTAVYFLLIIFQMLEDR